MPQKSRLRRALSRWASTSHHDATELRRTFSGTDAQPIGEAPDRERVVLRGRLRTVTLRPRGGVPALEAELYDGTGAVSLVFLGRRRIAGITPGRSVRVTGRIGQQEGGRVLYNPRYDLLP